jgi:hypothetical protein
MLLTWKRLGSLRRWSAADLCGRPDWPGVGGDDDELVDWSARPETPDQRDLEEELARRDLTGVRLLHVGVGNSGLAARLLGRCGGIDGLTVCEAERRHAESLGLAGYRVFRANKYARDVVRSLTPGYGFIIDNNPASYACCAYHFAQMLDNYRWALAPGGELLTHQRGLHWVAGDRRWRMTFDDLAAAARRFGLSARRVGPSRTEEATRAKEQGRRNPGTVYSLRRD